MSPCDTCDKIPCPVYAQGCKQWRDWWAKNWNDHIHRPTRRTNENVWRYEHPDLVRRKL